MRLRSSLMLAMLFALLFSWSSCMAAFPSTVKLQQDKGTVDLKLTGTATRKKFFVKVYDIAHYMQNPPSSGGAAGIRAILKDTKNPKQFTMKWLRDVPGKKINEGYKETFSKTLGSREAALKGEIKKFLSFFKKGAKSGDKHIIRWLDGGLITVDINKKKVGEIKNPAFAKAVWEIWFGPKAVVDKNSLVSKL